MIKKLYTVNSKLTQEILDNEEKSDVGLTA
jgi:hypothetical protein